MTAPSDPRMFGMFRGTVTTEADPKGLGRVRVKIPGMCEPESAWAYPAGLLGAGAADRGAFMVPPKHADVCVWFEQGDVDHPFYMGGNYGKPGGTSEVPEPAKSAGADAHKVQVLESDIWRCSMDNRAASPYLVIENKVTGDRIEIDGLTAGILLDAKAALVLKAVGIVRIDGLQVVINGRPVRPGADPI